MSRHAGVHTGPSSGKAQGVHAHGRGPRKPPPQRSDTQPMWAVAPIGHRVVSPTTHPLIRAKATADVCPATAASNRCSHRSHRTSALSVGRAMLVSRFGFDVRREGDMTVQVINPGDTRGGPLERGLVALTRGLGAAPMCGCRESVRLGLGWSTPDEASLSTAAASDGAQP
ncbi:hypothetical protein RHA1_ro08765 (plasmid) [Rhodococcus jostii RHA1]|uniref:Uncharacterized protein n=1 Tax=Rhodococcus jostii (strain RHA1) TaxID=101510 RepID=Q0RY27_RHOJR|nr:hypothetical protein RHA1_ro08765 [Rhodococcus jostii RHA1]